jgi:hypothetical protein
MIKAFPCWEAFFNGFTLLKHTLKNHNLHNKAG